MKTKIKKWTATVIVFFFVFQIPTQIHAVEIQEMQRPDLMQQPEIAVNPNTVAVETENPNDLTHVTQNSFLPNNPLSQPEALAPDFQTAATTTGMTQQLYRLYLPTTGNHLYTMSAAEKANALRIGYRDEGIAGYLSSTDTVDTAPLYRLYNPNASFHFYTMSEFERDAVINAGWRDEGIAGYMMTNGDLGMSPLFRVYNPVAGYHFFTMSAGETDYLVSLGWRFEGITGYMGTQPQTVVVVTPDAYNASALTFLPASPVVSGGKNDADGDATFILNQTSYRDFNFTYNLPDTTDFVFSVLNFDTAQNIGSNPTFALLGPTGKRMKVEFKDANGKVAVFYIDLTGTKRNYTFPLNASTTPAGFITSQIKEIIFAADQTRPAASATITVESRGLRYVHIVNPSQVYDPSVVLPRIPGGPGMPTTTVVYKQPATAAMNAIGTNLDRLGYITGSVGWAGGGYTYDNGNTMGVIEFADFSSVGNLKLTLKGDVPQVKFEIIDNQGRKAYASLRGIRSDIEQVYNIPLSQMEGIDLTRISYLYFIVEGMNINGHVQIRINRGSIVVQPGMETAAATLSEIASVSRQGGIPRNDVPEGTAKDAVIASLPAGQAGRLEADKAISNPNSETDADRDEAVNKAKDRLAEFLELTDEQINTIETVSANEASWMNGCVGWDFGENANCTMSVVNDYQVVLKYAGTEYEFHAGVLDPSKQPHILSPIPDGWMQAASNANFAFREHSFGGSIYAPVTLQLLNLTTGAMQDIVTIIPDFSGALSPKRDVAPNGKTAIYETGGAYTSAGGRIYTTHVQSIEDPSKKISIDNPFYTTSGVLHSILFEGNGNPVVRLRNSFEGTVIEDRYGISVNTKTWRVSRPLSRLISQGSSVHVDSDTKLVTMIWSIYNPKFEVWIYDATEGTNRMRILKKLVLRDGPGLEGAMTFIDAHTTPGGRQVVSFSFVGDVSDNPVTFTKVIDPRTGQEVVIDGVIKEVRYEGILAVYTVEKPGGSIWTHYVDLEAMQPLMIEKQTISLTTPLYRLYHPQTGDHLYTTNSAEVESAKASGYVEENIAGYLASSQEPGTQALYRLYNPNAGFHFYTMSAAERSALLASGYHDEGIAGYMFANAAEGTAPLYRLYNPNHGSHVFTMSEAERNFLTSQRGYTNEGIAGYLAVSAAEITIPQAPVIPPDTPPSPPQNPPAVPALPVPPVTSEPPAPPQEPPVTEVPDIDNGEALRAALIEKTQEALAKENETIAQIEKMLAVIIANAQKEVEAFTKDMSSGKLLLEGVKFDMEQILYSNFSARIPEPTKTKMSRYLLEVTAYLAKFDLAKQDYIDFIEFQIKINQDLLNAHKSYRGELETYQSRVMRATPEELVELEKNFPEFTYNPPMPAPIPDPRVPLNEKIAEGNALLNEARFGTGGGPDIIPNPGIIEEPPTIRPMR